MNRSTQVFYNGQPVSSGNPLPVRLSQRKYDTGWVSNSDWTFFKPTITHNLGVALSDLIVKLFISTDGTEANAFDVTPQAHYRDSSNVSVGITFYAINNNSFYLVTGANGIQSLQASDGIASAITTQSYYYKVKVYAL